MQAGATHVAIAQPEPATLLGRLATVEPANRRITVMPQETVDWVELFVAQDAQVEHKTRVISLADLVIHVGRRVTVQYRLDGEHRIADSIIVETD